MEFKQCIVIREDLKLSPGKLAVQVAHAAVMAVERAEKMDRSPVSEWKAEGQKKVVLKAPGVPDLFRLREDAERAGIASASMHTIRRRPSLRSVHSPSGIRTRDPVRIGRPIMRPTSVALSCSMRPTGMPSTPNIIQTMKHTVNASVLAMSTSQAWRRWRSLEGIAVRRKGSCARSSRWSLMNERP